MARGTPTGGLSAWALLSHHCHCDLLDCSNLNSRMVQLLQTLPIMPVIPNVSNRAKRINARILPSR
jgi:hypothetical protein